MSVGTHRFRRPASAGDVEAATLRSSRGGSPWLVESSGPRRHEDSGGVTAEVAVLAPMLILCMLFVVVVGQVAQAQQDVTQAAAEAARVASLDRGADATTTARLSARSNLTAAGTSCRSLAVDVTGTATTPGGSVRVSVSCVVDLRSVAAPGLPRQRTVSASAVEVIDTYRGGR
jgi:Flp pilus assembly protein TadG